MKIRVFTPQEITAIIEEARRNIQSPSKPNQRRAVLFAILCHYGRRVTEALQLRWKDIDFEQTTITFMTLKKFKWVNAAVVKPHDEVRGEKWIERKGARVKMLRVRDPAWHTLPLLDPVFGELWMLRQTDQAARPEDRLFPFHGGNGGRATVWSAFQRILKRLGIPRVKLHQLRHSCISTLAKRTKDAATVSEFVNHESIRSTEPYIHAIGMEETFQRIGSVYGGSSGFRPPPPADHDVPSSNGACHCSDEVLSRIMRMERAFMMFAQEFAANRQEPAARADRRMLPAWTTIGASEEPPPRKTKLRLPIVPGGLREKLSPYDLESPTKLGAVLGTSRQHADQILNGRSRLSVKVGNRIAEAIGVPLPDVLQWQRVEYRARASEENGAGDTVAPAAVMETEDMDTQPRAQRNGRLHETEQATILEALRQTAGNKPAAARVLGISVRGLYYKVKRMSVEEAIGTDKREEG